MKLYQRDTSVYSYKVRLLLAFLHVPYEAVAVKRLPDGRNDVGPEYLRLNPRGQIPTLEDDGVVLWGSTAILTYIALRYDPPRHWLPGDAAAAAEVAQWLELAQNEVRTGLFLTRAISRFGYAGDLDKARSTGQGALRLLEQRLCGRPWLVGERPTLADLACFPEVALNEGVEFKPAEFPSVLSWLQRFRSFEGFVPPAIPKV
ncbi:glutathione S-transferase family protein [Polaromonas sp. CT11-55]|uniref:glutathione S-transferase family protein n=1 Tax=Polaromonas sp. CT11-55 TaxID=3243045 RepID=UPI0039A4EE68